MNLKVERIFKGEKYTIGKLYVDGVFFCNTLEDKVRDLTKEKKVKGETAIPEGKYEVVLSYSPRFKKVMPELKNVPHFEGIRIHSGNTEKDSSGCLLVGFNTIKGKLTDSRVTYNKLMNILANEKEINIEII